MQKKAVVTKLTNAYVTYQMSMEFNYGGWFYFNLDVG
jgi:hypothetical protein